MLEFDKIYVEEFLASHIVKFFTTENKASLIDDLVSWDECKRVVETFVPLAKHEDIASLIMKKGILKTLVDRFLVFTYLKI